MHTGINGLYGEACKRAGCINKSSGKYAASSDAHGVTLRFIVYSLTL
jgi:hypothetical protein